MPTHHLRRGYIRCSGGAELKRCFSDEGRFGTILLTPEDIIGFRSSTFNVGQNNNGGTRVDR
jgi:hypothetical protein